MSSFARTRLGEVADFVMGQAPPSADCNARGSGTVFVKAGEFGERFPVTREWTTKPLKTARLGDVLVCVVGATAGKINEAIDCAIGRSVAAVRPNSANLSTAYLFHFLRTQVTSLRVKSQGVAQGVITNEMLRDLAISLPPLAEQRRIAEILDKADALRAKRRAALAQLDTLTQSIFLEMFGDPLGEGWRMTIVAGISAGVAAIRTGPFGSQLLHSEFVDNGVAVLGIDNAVENEFRWVQRRFITEAKYRKLSRYTVHPGDVLITLMGTCGRCAVVPDDVPLAINTKHLCCITVNRATCLPEFLHSYFLRHPIAQRYLRQTAKGAVMDGLNMGIIKEMPIPLPPIALQKRYADLVQTLSRVRTGASRSALELKTMFGSLQHRAFHGVL